MLLVWQQQVEQMSCYQMRKSILNVAISSLRLAMQHLTPVLAELGHCCIIAYSSCQSQQAGQQPSSQLWPFGNAGLPMMIRSTSQSHGPHSTPVCGTWPRCTKLHLTWYRRATPRPGRYLHSWTAQVSFMPPIRKSLTLQPLARR